MQRQQLEAIAARDPARPGQIIAARRFGGTQITVLAAPAATPRASEWLDAGRYLDTYRWLLSQPTSGDGFVLHDLNGVGLSADREPGHAFDMFQQGDSPQVAFDGDWRTQALSVDEYCAAFSRAAAAYVHALQVLLGVGDAGAEPRGTISPNRHGGLQAPGD